MAKIGNVEFNVISEVRNYNNDVTRHPVEKGVDITDHVKRQPTSYSIAGFVGDDNDPGNVHVKLLDIFKRGKPVNYVGRSMMSHCIVENFTSDVDSNSEKGFSFSMTITEIRIAKPSTIGLLTRRLKVDMAQVGNVGRVQAK